jgi:hypothetical protein
MPVIDSTTAVLLNHSADHCLGAPNHETMTRDVPTYRDLLSWNGGQSVQELDSSRVQRFHFLSALLPRPLFVLVFGSQASLPATHTCHDVTAFQCQYLVHNLGLVWQGVIQSHSKSPVMAAPLLLELLLLQSESRCWLVR